MHHQVVEEWSRRRSPLHARDARVKLGVLLVFLFAVATTPSGSGTALLGFSVLVFAASLASRLPLRNLLLRAALVLPFSAAFALLTWWGGNATLAWTIAAKALLSGLASLLLIATTPLVELADGLEMLRVPRMIVLVIEFVYRYLFVISEQAQHMRLAAQARSARTGFSFQGAAGAVGILFVRSWERAEGIHSAMLARGFNGHFPILEPAHLHTSDTLFFALSAAACVVIRASL